MPAPMHREKASEKVVYIPNERAIRQPMNTRRVKKEITQDGNRSSPKVEHVDLPVALSISAA